MFKPVFISLLGLLAFHAHATFCDPGLLIYRAQEKPQSLFTKAHAPNTPLRFVALCKRADGYTFYLGDQDNPRDEDAFLIPTFSLKTEPESPKGGFNFTHNNIEYSLFEDDLSLLYLYNKDKSLLDVIELANHADNYYNALF